MSRANHRLNQRHPHQLMDVAAIKHFMLAGRATLTLKSLKTGVRFTFKVSQANREVKHEGEGLQTWEPIRGKFFVKVLTRPDNYEYLGWIENDINWNHSPRGRISGTAASAKAWAWFWRQLNHPDTSMDVLTNVCEIWHEGSCGRCGRALTVPESIANGIGPECAQAMMAQGLLDSIM